MVGQKAGTNMSEINMTPMIDVLLVLLVIFIIVQPMLQLSLDVQLPIESEEEATAPPLPPIVLEIAANGAYSLNTQPVSDLPGRLRQVFSARPDKVLFVKADPNVPFSTVIGAWDIAMGAGVEVLGAVLPSAADAFAPGGGN
jgi:biopolymer transport protein ExbD/biopolymer transport protein TolR